MPMTERELGKEVVVDDWREKLRNWGVEVDWLDENSELDLGDENRTGAYIEHLREFLIEDHLGELPINQELRVNVQKRHKMAIYAANMGFGHHRVGRAFLILAKTLGVKSEVIDISHPEPGKDTPKLAKIFASIEQLYVNSSNLLGKKEGTTTHDVLYEEKPDNPIAKVIHEIKKYNPALYEKIVIGNTDRGFTPKQAKFFYSLFTAIYGLDADFRNFAKRNGITHHLSVYPIINMVMPYQRVLTIGTDSVLEPSGWLPHKRLLVETQMAKEIMKKAWGKRLDKNVMVMGGFPAPVKALMISDYLSEKRAQKLAEGEPVMVVLPASGVATAQLGKFKGAILELAPEIAAGRVRLVVQCGTNHLGEVVKKEITELIGELSEEHPGIDKNVALHFAEKTKGALDFFEVLAASESPMVLGVKGSEMARIAVQLGIPHIAIGAIGEHEKWNVVFSLLQKAATYLVYPTPGQLKEFVMSKIFPADLRQEAQKALEENNCEDMVEAVEKARARILNGNNAIGNRLVMLEALGYLLGM